MELIFMGTGTSQGVPMIAHDSIGLDLKDSRNWRTRTSVHVSLGNHHFQVDAAPEFRLQCIENNIASIDAFILTHGHADHIVGMDDLRRFIDLRDGEALPVYSTEEGHARVRNIFPYAICDRPVTPGYPAFSLIQMPDFIEIDDYRIHSTLLPHGNIEVLGLVFERLSTEQKIVYYTDCSRIPEAAKELAKGADIIVLDALRHKPHPSHMTLAEAIEVAHELEGKQTYFTHMTYMIDHGRESKDLPPRMAFAYDGLKVSLS